MSLIAALLKVGTGKASLTTVRLLTSGLLIEFITLEAPTSCLKLNIYEAAGSRSRGGFEDTRLKAKNRNAQGHKRKCFQNKKKVFKNYFWRSPKKSGLEKHFSADFQNFNHSKDSDVLEPRTGQFSRTCGFKANDFKMCPRGLHLCQEGWS